MDLLLSVYGIMSGMAWGPKEIGVLLGQLVLIVLTGWHFNRNNTLTIIDHLNAIDAKITDLTRRILQVENKIQTYEIDQSSMRDRVSRGESRTDMLYVLIGGPSHDPFPHPEKDKRLHPLNTRHRRRITDYPARGEEDE